MAGSPKYKVYRDGKYVAACKFAEDAAALIAVSDCGEVRFGHSTVLWSEGSEEFSAGESYDRTAEVIQDRERQMHEKSYAKQQLRKRESTSMTGQLPRR